MANTWRRGATALALAVAPLATTRFASTEPAASPLAPPPPALSPSELRRFTLTKAEVLTHDTKRYTFALPRENDELGLPVASCLVVKMDIDGKAVTRPYTPTSPANQRGSMELIIKSYEQGKVSKAFDSLVPGDTVEMKGPFVKFHYTANQWSAIGMLAGGTGIAPMYQLLLEILSNPRDKTEVRLIYASRTPSDIILKDELDALATVYPNFKVLYTVDSATGGASPWTGATGFVTADMIKSFLPPPSLATGQTLLCGPPGFMKHLSGEKKSASEQGELTGLLATLKYDATRVFKY